MLVRSRREFLNGSLKSIATLSAAGSLAKFGEMNAFAASTASGYQALVCVYLAGGNDGHNTIIPITTAQQNYSLYAAGRANLAIGQSTLLPITDGKDVYGLHPSLPEIANLYKQGKAAVLANVGNLVLPMNRSGYLAAGSGSVPASLFSHSDQSSQWQSGIPNSIAASGWGGRLGDYMLSANSGAVFPPVISTGSCGLFCAGAQTYPATVPPTGMATLQVQNSASQAGLQQLLSFDNGLQLVQSSNALMTRGNTYANTLTGLLKNASLNTQFPAGNTLADQLLTVAKIMSVRSSLGLSRQIFFCQLGGFDTHNGQTATQTALLTQLSQAVGAFYAATQELGIDQQVTTFTASEFGRTLVPNGNDGSDHAWGNHHFILGGGVAGGKFYGSFPSLAPGSANDTNTRGTLIPTTSVSQYGATLAKWFGVSAGNLPTIFPNLGNFSSPYLSFLG